MSSLTDQFTLSATLKREGNCTQLFCTQGSTGAVNIKANPNTGEVEIIPQKCYKDYRECRFASSCPTLPLCSPNKGLHEFVLKLRVNFTSKLSSFIVIIIFD